SDAGVEGAHRFLRRLWKLAFEHVNAGIVVAANNDTPLRDAQKDLRRKLHQTIQKVSDDYGRRQQFNTVIAAVMELLNAADKTPLDDASGRALRQELLEAAVLMLFPIVPHIGEAIYAELRPSQNVDKQRFPVCDPTALVQSEIELVLQINGKHRGSVRVAADADKASIETTALASEAAQKQLNGAAPKKVVVVPGRLVNIVA
ncbi:MAG: class I tRNA ligase family protein, partial [Fluviibacter sp.]